MTNIKALLNPMSERRLPPPFTPIHNPRITDSPNSSRKKARVAKDAAIFNHAPINGEVRFPPDEYQDDILAAHHQQFEVTPFGEIADYPRHIPYNAEKKQFAERTNRTFLEGMLQLHALSRSNPISLPVHLQDTWRRHTIPYALGL